MREIFKWIKRGWRVLSDLDTALSWLSIVGVPLMPSLLGLWAWFEGLSGPIIVLIVFAGIALLLFITTWILGFERRPTKPQLLTSSGSKVGPKLPGHARETQSINWNKLAIDLKNIRQEHSNAHLIFVTGKRPIFEKLKSTFDLAGWETSAVPSAFDQYPQGGAFSYYEGMEVKGINRVVVESVAKKLEQSGFNNVYTTIQDTNIKSDNPKWERVQQRVSILIGNDPID